MNELLLSRRALIAGACAAAMPGRGFAQARRYEPQVGAWRQFETTTTVTVADPQGATQVWLPLPDVDTDWQRTLGHDWRGNASSMRVVADAERGVRMLRAEFPASVSEPTLTLVSRVRTRGRAVDWSKPDRQRAASEDPAVLRAALAPTELMPTDGLVRTTALEATRGAQGEVEKTRALYRWVVERAHREPKVKGCGTGDVRTMLETGNLGGKCADLNAIFVAMSRSIGIPARDLYGLRVAPSAFGYRELGANTPANIKGAQHCRAEVFLRAYGWVAMDPADVLKVMRQETAQWIKDPNDPVAAPVRDALFGACEGNWIAYNTAHDVRLPGSAAKGTLGFLMYPQGENASGAFDSLNPDTFRYAISASEIA